MFLELEAKARLIHNPPGCSLTERRMRYQEPDYYAVLGVLPSVEQAALAAVYRALLKKYHPDVFEGSKAEAEQITKELNEAYEVLGDPETPAQYDARRAASQGRSGDYVSAA